MAFFDQKGMKKTLDDDRRDDLPSRSPTQDVVVGGSLKFPSVLVK
jgi:hypothetical protein